MLKSRAVQVILIWSIMPTLIFVACWAIGSFMGWEMNPAKWETPSRSVLVACWATITFAACSFAHIFTNKG